MAEDEDEDNGEQDHGALIAGLEEGDLKPNFYEGGFKTWECSLDLAKCVVDDDDDVDGDGDFHVVEVSTLFIGKVRFLFHGC